MSNLNIELENGLNNSSAAIYCSTGVSSGGNASQQDNILDPGFSLTLRPMKYPQFYDMYLNGIKNTWSVDEISFTKDISQLEMEMSEAQKHLVKRLVAFFATGDTIVSNNLVLNLYKHINAPEARMYLSRQLFEEAQHIQFYLTLLDAYIPEPSERTEAFQAIENIPSIQKKADFCFKWINNIHNLDQLDTKEKRKQFLLNLICFATCIEGLFFFGAFAYVYYLRSIGLLPGLADGTNWVFRDESAHIEFALSVIETVRMQEPDLFDLDMEEKIKQMIDEAVQCELQFANDVLSLGLSGINEKNMQDYLQFVADNRLLQLGLEKQYNSKNPFPFMELQDIQELTNFFERRASAYQVGVQGDISFDEDF